MRVHFILCDFSNTHLLCYSENTSAHSRDVANMLACRLCWVSHNLQGCWVRKPSCHTPTSRELFPKEWQRPLRACAIGLFICDSHIVGDRGVRSEPYCRGQGGKVWALTCLWPLLPQACSLHTLSTHTQKNGLVWAVSRSSSLPAGFGPSCCSVISA